MWRIGHVFEGRRKLVEVSHLVDAQETHPCDMQQTEIVEWGKDLPFGLSIMSKRAKMHRRNLVLNQNGPISVCGF